LPILSFTFFVGVCWLINSTIFDIKDIAGDHAQNVKTLPVQIGLANTKLFCAILNVILVLFLSILVITNILPSLFVVMFFINAYIFAYIFLAKAKNNPLFYGIFVDGEFIAFTIIFFTFI
jgi:4-hydroxybenzoate polyprenyltransferase